MKKGTIIAIIVAIVLIIAGGMLVVLGLSFAGDGTRESVQMEQEVIITEHFDSIQIDTEDCDVVFVEANDIANPYVAIREKARTQHSVQVEDGTLKIQMLDNRSWMDYISIFGMGWESMEMTVCLPENQYSLLRVVTNTGDIAVPDGLSFAAAELFSDTGEIRLAATVTDRITTGTDTGDIYVTGSTPTMLNVSSDTGDVELVNMDCGDCTVKTTTGEIDLKNLNCQSLDCTSDTGDMEMERLIAQKHIKAISCTGDVELMECDGESITVQTDTGDISGVLLSPKEFFAETDTGRERIADHAGTVTGTCYIESNTGDISFGYTK